MFILPQQPSGIIEILSIGFRFYIKSFSKWIGYSLITVILESILLSGFNFILATGFNFHRSNAPRCNAAVDAPASSYVDKQRWSVVSRIPTQSVGTMTNSNSDC